MRGLLENHGMKNKEGDDGFLRRLLCRQLPYVRFVENRSTGQLSCDSSTKRNVSSGSKTRNEKKRGLHCISFPRTIVSNINGEDTVQ